MGALMLQVEPSLLILEPLFLLVVFSLACSEYILIYSMREKMRTSVATCTNKKWKAIRSEVNKNDRLSKLPDEVLLSIISTYTMKEAARLSPVSRRFGYLWRLFPVLIFEDPKAMESIATAWNQRPQVRDKFVRWINGVLERHLGPAIDELRIVFDLDKMHQSDFDKWVGFAIEKQVKTLELKFTQKWTGWFMIRMANPENLPICGEPLDLSCNITSIRSSLTSLSLEYVNVTDELVDGIIRSCVSLENLCIVGSRSLTRVSGALDLVKRLEVSYCRNLKTVHISAPKLLSFIHFGHPIELRIAEASSLSEVSAGDLKHGHCISYVFSSISEYLTKLKYLCLMNLQVNIPPLANLKHLELRVIAVSCQSLLGWASMIMAAPRLQKLTLKFNILNVKLTRPIRKLEGSPLQCLKTLEISGFMGQPIDLEFAAYLLENAIVLEEVIVDFRPLFFSKPSAAGRQKLIELEKLLPPRVKLIVK